jgi:hypothetical protein
MRTIILILVLAAVLGAGLYFRQNIADRLTGKTATETATQLTAQPVADSVVAATAAVTAVESTAAPVAAAASPTPAAVRNNSIAQLTPAAGSLPQTGPELLAIPAGASLIAAGLVAVRARRRSQTRRSSLHIL